VPSKTHEILIQLVRNQPIMVATLLSESLNIPVPDFVEARIESAEFNHCSPIEYRADAVVSLGVGSTPKLAVVVEVQLSQDPKKRRTWPAYLATLRDRMDCPVMLLVLCEDKNTATWCAEPIEMGHPGWTLWPLVIGPDRVPVVVDPERAVAVPELAVMSAYSHGADLEGPDVLRAFLAALEVVDEDDRHLYRDFVYTRLSKAAKEELKALMDVETYDYQSDFAKSIAADIEARIAADVEARIAADVEARGEAKTILKVLAARGVSVPEDARNRIEHCTHPATLDTWVERAATATTINDLFNSDAS
jgi:hypothetical protein